jgi:hypothetical protein
MSAKTPGRHGLRCCVLLFRSLTASALALALGAAPARPLTLQVTVLGSPSDSRAIAVQEAVAFWNQQLEHAGARVRLGPVQRIDDPLSDQILRDLSEEVMDGRSVHGLSRLINQIPGDVIIAMSNADLISFGVEWRRGAKGFIALRSSDVPPLSLPNVARNAVAHELGHVLGLPHNADPSTLMCGRPAPCRPGLFASDTDRFFPLTPLEDRHLRELWP